MTEYTPTTDEIRDGYAESREIERVYHERFDSGDQEVGEQHFDRWLAAHDAEVAAKALREAAAGWEQAAALGIESVHNLTAAKSARRRADHIEREATTER